MHNLNQTRLPHYQLKIKNKNVAIFSNTCFSQQFIVVLIVFFKKFQGSHPDRFLNTSFFQRKNYFINFVKTVCLSIAVSASIVAQAYHEIIFFVKYWVSKKCEP